ncbi:MAG: beta-ketoacyl-[acyl-carrier-protein] synthase family protein [Candidatus Omnitrophota bacterium]
MNEVVITGLGVVSPSGVGKRQFWANIKFGRSFISKIERFDASLYRSHIAGVVKGMDTYTHLSERLLKKIDLFSHMALVASEAALTDANIDMQNENKDRTGIFMGNAIGGWLYAETELRDLYLEGREGVSPYMASAWFPAAPQGQISIYYEIKGYSKTVVSDRASSLQAIGYARKVLKQNKLDLILAGGMEAPVTPYALLCCNTSGVLSDGNDSPQTAYKPFDKDRNGFAIGEGSGVLILESLERAKKRNAQIYAKILGFATNCDGVDRIKPDINGAGLAAAIELALKDANVTPDEIDYICADGAATYEADISETRAIKKVFKDRAKKIPVSAPKAMFGNLLGASGAVDTISTILAMQNNLAPATINYQTPDPECDLDYVPNQARETKIDKALIISRGRGGINAVLVLGKV